MYRFEAAGEVFLCARPPRALTSTSVQAAVERALAGRDRPPSLLYWDAEPSDGCAGGWVHFGRGGLDPILACETDLSGCVGVARHALLRLVSRRAIQSEDDLVRATALLARAPGVESVWCEGLAGSLSLGAPPPLANARGPATHAEGISLVVLVDSQTVSVEPFFAALRGQAIAGQLDVVVLAAGLQSQDVKALAKTLEASGAADPRLRIRRYSLSGDLSAAYLANMGAGLAVFDAVVIADARCVPVSPNAVQRLADWAVTGDAAAACPRVVFDGALLAAGLALVGSEAQSAVLWNDPIFSDRLRTAAAPAPWFFALRRNAWLTAGGLRGDAGAGLWTAEIAFAHGPKGRTFLVGAEIVEWIGTEPPAPAAAAAPAHMKLRAFAQTALRDPTASASPVALPTRGSPGPAPPAATDEDADYGFSDPFPSGAATKVLVFADVFGASQSIAFVEGLASARAEGAVAVRICEEAAFPGDSRRLQQPPAADLVQRQVDEVEPDVIVLSRLGHAGVWSAVEAIARRRGTPVVFHIDDDVPNLPPAVGLERYRLGRNPRRMQTLRNAMAGADLILASTPALAERLIAETGREQVVALGAGTAGRPPQPRAPRAANGPLVIGYMGSASHDHDLAMIAPALNRVLADYSHVKLVLFGSIAEQPSAGLIQGAVERHRPVQRDYAGFRRRLGELEFDIGLAPLRDSAFNRMKTPTKWAEYAEAGSAALVSRVEPYLDIAAAGAALAVGPEQWEHGLRSLVEAPALRQALVSRADALLLERFGWGRLEQAVLEALASARGISRRAA